MEPRYILKNNWLYIEARSYFFFTREAVQRISCTTKAKHPVLMKSNNEYIHVKMRKCLGWHAFAKDTKVYFNDYPLYGMKIIESDPSGDSFKAATRAISQKDEATCPKCGCKEHKAWCIEPKPSGASPTG